MTFSLFAFLYFVGMAFASILGLWSVYNYSIHASCMDTNDVFKLVLAVIVLTFLSWFGAAYILFNFCKK